jgi:hypothetical protein
MSIGNNIQKWQEEYPEGKAVLSWSLSDYLIHDEEPPACVIGGICEGQSMDEDDIEKWAKEEYHTLCILRDEYPEKFKDHYRNFVLDLEYLHSLGKISKEDLDDLKKEENICFEAGK